MIKIENTETYGFEAAIRGMRNPMNSWDKSDSESYQYGFDITFKLGENDLELMKQLVKAGTDHSKFMRMITVTCDITAPLFWTKELDTYKVGTVRNSCSTMHTIHKKKFDIDDFSFDNLSALGMNMLQDTICMLNILRKYYINTTEKSFWYDMIAILPSCYNQRFTWQANYAVLRNIYHARKNHKLTEWHAFCKWIESLPYSELITED
ncbi:MAG TPA: hypothetical protein DCO72_02075 [Ruminococcus sp.]|nr:hypothetical protein [Ruminococcus sp.]